jgi:hypothetical protein
VFAVGEFSLHRFVERSPPRIRLEVDALGVQRQEVTVFKIGRTDAVFQFEQAIPKRQ